MQTKGGKSKGGGKDQKQLEKVDYMEKDEIKQRAKKEADERQKRRELVDGAGAGGQVDLDRVTMGGAGGSPFELSSL